MTTGLAVTSKSASEAFLTLQARLWRESLHRYCQPRGRCMTTWVSGGDDAEMTDLDNVSTTVAQSLSPEGAVSVFSGRPSHR